MRRAVYAGDFDPITKGHYNIIERSCEMFDEVYVVILTSRKVSEFSLTERLTMLEKTLAHLPKVKIASAHGLVVDFAKKVNASVLIRGIRAVMDFEYELQQATTNQLLNPDVETVFLLSRPRYSFMTSSAVNEIALHGGLIDSFVPKAAIEVIDQHFKSLR